MEVDDCSPTLDTLPAELLLHILQYIEVHYHHLPSSTPPQVEYVLAVVARVCSYFHSITSDPTTWRVGGPGPHFTGFFLKADGEVVTS